MKRIVVNAIFVFTIAICGISYADDLTPIPIAAEDAFDAVQNQTDPVTGEEKRIALVDVRSRAEYFWVGSACQVDEIVTSEGRSIIPDNGKVTLSWSGLFLNFEVNGCKKFIRTKKVSELKLSPIAINIPYKLWDETTGTLSENNSFASTVEELSYEYDTLIFFCRSGGRSEDCLAPFDTTLFEKIYEIDQPDGKSGRGGFEGTSYSNAYNGYRGFPGRLTKTQDHPSVSWKDSGLPIITSVNPLAN